MVQKNNMTDNEIIKALEEYSAKYNMTHNGKQAKVIFDLINRQKEEIENYKQVAENQQKITMDRGFEIKELKAEIERLKNHIQEGIDLAKQIPEMLALTKTEAYKEFAERFMQMAKETTINYVADASIQKRKTGWLEISKTDFDNLLKELVGEGE